MAPDPGVDGTPSEVGHHNVGPPVVGHIGMENGDDVGVACQSAGRTLLPDESFAVRFVEVGGEYLDGHRALEGCLRTPVHDSETATTYLTSILEPDLRQLRRDRAGHPALGRERVHIVHRHHFTRQKHSE